jgi:hypothetical protein
MAESEGSSYGGEVDSKAASEVIKKLAERQRIRIELTDDQLARILDQWDVGDPYEPAEITFHVGERDAVQLKLAGYWYRGDTCCV